jgi:hypothetical protein
MCKGASSAIHVLYFNYILKPFFHLWLNVPSGVTITSDAMKQDEGEWTNIKRKLVWAE